MSERWQQYFDQHGAFDSKWLESAVSHWGFNLFLYRMIQKHYPPPARILDIGCGPGWSDVLLGSMGYEVTGLDNDEVIIASASTLNERMSVNGLACFVQGDAFNLEPWYGAFDLVFSCGVLEHFDRETTVRLLREQAKCAPSVLIQVPTKYSALYIGATDERFYTIRELQTIVREAELRVKCAFGYGEIAVTLKQKVLKYLLPYGAWRWLQNRGYCFGIAVLGARD